MYARRLRDAFPADHTTHSPPKTFARPAQQHALPKHFRSPTQPRRTPAGCAIHTRRPHNTFPAADLRPPPAQRHALPEHFRSSTQPRRTPAGYTMHARRPHNTFPAAPRCLPFRSASGTKKRHRTASVRCRMFRSTVVRSVIWGLCRASVRRRCGAVARQRGA